MHDLTVKPCDRHRGSAVGNLKSGRPIVRQATPISTSLAFMAIEAFQALAEND